MRPFSRKARIAIDRARRHIKNAMHRGDYPERQLAKLIGPSVAVIGGGTGLSTLLRGLKDYTDNITAIVTVADDGGGSGALRRDMGMLPPGDIRNCIMALANAEPTMQTLINHRFRDGTLAGQSFGNLFLAALNDIYGSFDEAVRRMSEVLAVTGRVLPVTCADVRLRADFEDGSSVVGESLIAEHKKLHKCRISRVELVPSGPAAHPEVISALLDADLIVYGPGSLYTSIIPNLLVSGVAEAASESGALKLYVCNVMTQEGETERYTAFDHASALIQHGGAFSACLVNSAPVPPAIAGMYVRESAAPVEFDSAPFRSAGIRVYKYPVLSDARDKARHDPAALSAAIIDIYRRETGRAALK